MKRGSQQQGREEVTSLEAIGNGEEKAAKRKKDQEGENKKEEEKIQICMLKGSTG
jgi:hypothetical protein